MPQSHFIAAMMDDSGRGYVYACIEGKHYRIVSPTTEDSYVVRFNDYQEMRSDIDAIRHLHDGLICINSQDYSPFDGNKLDNLAEMLSMQGRLVA